MKIATVIGARPEFVQTSTVSRALRTVAKEILIHTGQHYDQNMSEEFFQQLHLPKPDYNLAVGSGTHGQQTAKIIEGIELILDNEKPDLVIVHGDTNSTIGGSLAAAKMNIPVAHVESGLRSFNRHMPEEINRIVTDHISSLLFCPTDGAIKNLNKEGITERVFLTGDVMYDAILFYREIAMQQSSILKRYNLSKQDYYLATVHRAENTRDPATLKKILDAFVQLDRMVVFPVHPRTEKLINQWGLGHILQCPNILVIPAVPYLDMLALELNALMIITDSGGVQKEAYFLHTPCVTLRNETEWTETLLVGWNHLGGNETNRILNTISSVTIPSHSPPIFGDGHAADKIVKIITEFCSGK